MDRGLSVFPGVVETRYGVLERGAGSMVPALLAYGRIVDLLGIFRQAN